MGISVKFFFVPLFLAHFLTLPVARKNPLFYVCSNGIYDGNDDGNFTTNSTYQTNLNRLFSSFNPNSENDYGFYNISIGKNSDQVNSIVLCRGDVQPNVCLSCINNATTELRNRCPNQKEAVLWYDDCMFRYSNRSIYGELQFTTDFNISDKGDVWDVFAFNSALGALLYNLSNRAALGSSLRKFATGTVPGPSSYTIYALVQCMPYLSQQQCSYCLSQSLSQIPVCCDGKPGGRIFGKSCNLRFENYPFYNATADGASSLQPPTGTTQSPPSNGKDRNLARKIIIIVVLTIGSLILIFLIGIFILLRVRNLMKKVETDKIQSAEALQYDFSTIIAATNSFSDANKLGQGGFGAVYKGRLANGQEIAVKRLSTNSGQGDQEFKNEVQLVAGLQHKNLVRLHGFCLEGKERLLIYEFVQNSSLDNFLFDPMKCTQLDWNTRYEIIGGVVQGILYLHEGSRLRIVHRDLKASNVLLDAEMNPKISDFGMAILFRVDQSQTTTSTIVGTHGYMAPEYAVHGQISLKIDVFSFGVLVLEIISGQKNNSFHHGENVVDGDQDLISYAWRNWRQGTLQNIIDPNLRGGSRAEIMRCINVALLCVQENVVQRPTMASVDLMLTSNSMTLPVPLHFAFMHSTTQPSMSSSLDFSPRAIESHQSRYETAFVGDNDGERN
ncbi:hypothetical protein SLE2022_173690 [Rubroshorea leprosula]